MAYTKKNKKNKNGDNCIAAVDIPTLCCKSVSAIIYFVSFIDWSIDPSIHRYAVLW